MPFAAASNARRSKGGHGGSEEETRPLNPNRDDYEDIENPFGMPSEVSKLDKKCGQECLNITTTVVILVIVGMLFIHVMNAILQWNGVPGPCTVLQGADKSSISKMCF